MSLRLSAKHAEVSLTAAPVDFHTHLLPCMDDGSVSPLESRRMLDIMCADGVSEIVLTPHFYPDRESPDTFLSRRAESVAALRTILRLSDPRLYLGAEVAYYVGSAHRVSWQNFVLRERPTCFWKCRLTVNGAVRSFETWNNSGTAAFVSSSPMWSVILHFGALRCVGASRG